MNNSHVGLALKSAVSIYIHIEMGIAIALQLQKSSLLYGCYARTVITNFLSFTIHNDF